MVSAYRDGTIGESCLYLAAWDNLKVLYSNIASRISYAVTWWRCPERRSVYCRFLSWTFWRRIPCVHIFFLSFTPRLEPYRMKYPGVQVHRASLFPRFTSATSKLCPLLLTPYPYGDRLPPCPLHSIYESKKSHPTDTRSSSSPITSFV